MGYTSVSGIAFAALTLALATLPSPLAATDGAAPSAGTVSLNLSNMRSARGNMLICVTSNPRAFPDCSRDAAAQRLRIPAAQAAHVALSVPAGANYAIAIVHDENGNGRLDTMLAMPREGFGFSRNPRLRMGPPPFAEAAFTVGSATVQQDVRLRYML
jgi:uncharacterized protein (DUF2141 family)